MNTFFLSLTLMAASSSSLAIMRDYVGPVMKTLTAIAAIASVFFTMHGGILYMTSVGKPEKLEHAKRVLKNALIGLVIVLIASTLTAILNGAFVHVTSPASATLPQLQAIEPQDPGNGLTDVILKAITGLLNTIIQAIAVPFLAALTFFTAETPLMTTNPTVFTLWLAIVGITDILFVVIIALLGFHVMSASTFGLDDINIKQLLPRIGLVFLLLNSSIFLIDGFIELSNVLIRAVQAIGGSHSVWDTLTAVVKESGGQGVAALLVMLVFLIVSIVLLVYYVGRLVTLYIGTVLSPLIVMLWLIPGFRDFSETAIKTYLTTVYVLFVHVVILQIAASLFTGMSGGAGHTTPNILMSLVVGLAAVVTLLKTQGVMMQFSYVSLGARSTRQLGATFMNGVSYLGGRGIAGAKAGTSAISRRVQTSSRGTVQRSIVSSSSSQLASQHARSNNHRVTVTRTPSLPTREAGTPTPSSLPSRRATSLSTTSPRGSSPPPTAPPRKPSVKENPLK